MQLATIEELARYWTTEYDWRRCEARLNALPQFMTYRDGIANCVTVKRHSPWSSVRNLAVEGAADEVGLGLRSCLEASTLLVAEAGVERLDPGVLPGRAGSM